MLGLKTLFTCGRYQKWTEPPAALRAQTSSRPGVGPGVGRPQWWHWGIMIGMTTAIRNHLQNWFETVKRYAFLLMLLVSERMKFKIIKHQGWCHVEMFEMRPVDCSFLEFSRPVCYQVTRWHLRRFSIIFWWVLFCWLELCYSCSLEAITGIVGYAPI